MTLLDLILDQRYLTVQVRLYLTSNLDLKSKGCKNRIEKCKFPLILQEHTVKRVGRSVLFCADWNKVTILAVVETD